VSGSSITINTTGLSFPDDGFTLTETDIYVMSDESESVEAFFEGAENVYEGAAVNFSSEKIVIREIGDANKHAYTNSQMAMTWYPYIYWFTSLNYTDCGCVNINNISRQEPVQRLTYLLMRPVQ
jgi:hypothetical protein